MLLVVMLSVEAIVVCALALYLCTPKQSRIQMLTSTETFSPAADPKAGIRIRLNSSTTLPPGGGTFLITTGPCAPCVVELIKSAEQRIREVKSDVRLVVATTANPLQARETLRKAGIVRLQVTRLDKPLRRVLNAEFSPRIYGLDPEGHLLYIQSWEESTWLSVAKCCSILEVANAVSPR